MNDIFIIISELIKYRISSSVKYSELARMINVSPSFFDQAINNRNNKQFNLRHIFLISNYLQIPMSDLLPSRENLEIIQNKKVTDTQWNEIVENAYIHQELKNNNLKGN